MPAFSVVNLLQRWRIRPVGGLSEGEVSWHKASQTNLCRICRTSPTDLTVMIIFSPTTPATAQSLHQKKPPADNQNPYAQQKDQTNAP